MQLMRARSSAFTGGSDPGTTLSEDWSGYSNGDTWTQLDTLYFRNSTSFVPTINTDASAPGGLSCNLEHTGGNHRWMYRDDVATQLGGSWTTADFYAFFRLDSNQFDIWGMGYSASDGSHNGLRFRKGSVTNGWTVNRCIEEAFTAGTDITSDVVGTLADSGLVHALMQIEDDTIRWKIWMDGQTKPGTWDSATHTGTITFSHAGLILRGTGTNHPDCLFWGLGLDTDAPES